MIQKVIKVGNSYAVTIPMPFIKQTGLKVGEEVNLDMDIEAGKLLISKENHYEGVQTPEVKEWLEKFNKKYKKGLTELAKV